MEPEPNKKNRLAYIKREDLIKKADEFLNSYYPKRKIPIPIEEIVEIKLGFKIIAVPDLKNEINTDSYICIDQKTIVFDKNIYNNYVARTRFSYAHEIGYYYLHKNFETFYGIKNREDYKKFQNSITIEEYKRLEAQAYCFAGYVLVPQKEFRNLVSELMKRLGSIDSLTINDFTEIAQNLSKEFDVSGEVIRRQFEQEYPELIDRITKMVTRRSI